MIEPAPGTISVCRGTRSPAGEFFVERARLTMMCSGTSLIVTARSTTRTLDAELGPRPRSGRGCWWHRTARAATPSTMPDIRVGEVEQRALLVAGKAPVPAQAGAVETRIADPDLKRMRRRREQAEVGQRLDMKLRRCSTSELSTRAPSSVSETPPPPPTGGGGGGGRRHQRHRQPAHRQQEQRRRNRALSRQAALSTPA